MARYNADRDVKLSKTLSYLLRHGAVQENIPISDDGFVNVKDVLNFKTLKGSYNEEDIIRAIQSCPKKRFFLKYVDNDIFVRANQGHSLNVSVDLREITRDNMPSQCLHGTYMRAWVLISKQGLSRMSRQHIHLSEDFPGSKDVISGMRNNCQVAIYVDVAKALDDGIKFFRSENNVILTPGDENGFLKTRYFTRVVDLKTDQDIDF